MGLSARKEIADASWYLRINPSSGNLHPTEAYAVLPALEGLPGGAGVYQIGWGFPPARRLQMRVGIFASTPPAVTCIRRKPTPSCPPSKVCRVARGSIITRRCNTPLNNGHAVRKVPSPTGLG